MLIAKLIAAAPTGPVQEVSSPYFACVETELRTADGKCVAYQQRHFWYMPGGEVLASLDFGERVVVRFENPEMSRHEDLGPFQGLQLIDGAMWTGSPISQLIAEFHDALHIWSIRLKPAVPMPKFIATRARVS